MSDKYTLIIGNTWDVTKSMFLQENRKKNIDVSYNYNKLKRIGGKLANKYLSWNLPKKELFFEFKRLNLNKYDLIIIFECDFPERIISYIRRYNLSAKVVYWLWNSINNVNKDSCNDIKEIKKLILLQNIYNYQIYTFDKNDCSFYQFHYNNQVLRFFDKNINFIKYDTFFCGRDKSRLSKLKDLYEKLSRLYIRNKFLIYPDKNKIYDDEEKKFIMDKGISYEEMLDYVLQSKCIIDIVQINQGGLTWRPLEAMFYKKKLITNFKQIKEYDFYNKENIFILGEDDIHKIKKFINSKYIDVPKNIVRKYTIDGWIENFMKN